MGGVKPEHILSDDSILQAFVKNDLKKAVEFAEPSSSMKRSDLPESVMSSVQTPQPEKPKKKTPNP